MILQFFFLIASLLPVLGIYYPKYLAEARSVNCLCAKEMPKSLENCSGKSKTSLPFSFLFCECNCVIRLPMGIHLEKNTYVVSLLFML